MFAFILLTLLITACDGSSKSIGRSALSETDNEGDIYDPGSPDIGNTIHHGQETVEGEHPYMCLVAVKENGIWVPLCGCALFNAGLVGSRRYKTQHMFKYVVTSATCMAPWRTHMVHQVVLGMYELERDLNPCVGCQKIKVNQTFTHPGYNASLITGRDERNDIAVLMLEEEVVVNDRVLPVDLTKKTLPNYSYCNFTGWGETADEGRAHKLRIMKPFLFKKDKCQKFFNVVNKLTHQNTEICTLDYKNYSSMCTIDVGGPLVCTFRQSPVLIGTASWGMTNCNGCFPTVYTRVAKFVNWIKSIIETVDELVQEAKQNTSRGRKDLDLISSSRS